MRKIVLEAGAAGLLQRSKISDRKFRTSASHFLHEDRLPVQV